MERARREALTGLTALRDVVVVIRAFGTALRMAADCRRPIIYSAEAFGNGFNALLVLAVAPSCSLRPSLAFTCRSSRPLSLFVFPFNAVLCSCRSLPLPVFLCQSPAVCYISLSSLCRSLSLTVLFRSPCRLLSLHCPKCHSLPPSLSSLLIPLLFTISPCLSLSLNTTPRNPFCIPLPSTIPSLSPLSLSVTHCPPISISCRQLSLFCLPFRPLPFPVFLF